MRAGRRRGEEPSGPNRNTRRNTSGPSAVASAPASATEPSSAKVKNSLADRDAQHRHQQDSLISGASHYATGANLLHPAVRKGNIGKPPLYKGPVRMNRRPTYKAPIETAQPVSRTTGRNWPTQRNMLQMSKEELNALMNSL